MSTNKQASQTTAMQLQQRQVLNLMGIDVWVQHNVPTVMVDFDAQDDLAGFETRRISVSEDINTTLLNTPVITPIDSQNLSFNHQDSTKDVIAKQPIQPIDKTLNTGSIDSNNDALYIGSLNTNNTTLDTEHSVANLQSQAATAQPAIDEQNAITQSSPEHTYQNIKSQQVAAFDLLGARYHGWVFLIDAQHLKDVKIATLWQNMSHALSFVSEQLTFPICDGIQDKDSADASVAGFVFRLGGLNMANVASLTPLPEGLDVEPMIRVPYLMEMLADSRQKKQFWQLISRTS